MQSKKEKKEAPEETPEEQEQKKKEQKKNEQKKKKEYSPFPNAPTPRKVFIVFNLLLLHYLQL